jgi:hypothetical protein
MSTWKSFYCCSWSAIIRLCVLIDLKTHIASVKNLNVGRVSAVGIVTSYQLDGRGNRSLQSRDFSHPSREARAHPASYKMGTGSLYR